MQDTKIFPCLEEKMAFIFAAGEWGQESKRLAQSLLKQFEQDQLLLVAVDGGIKALDELGLAPHLYLGDMDSSKDMVLNHLSSELLLQKHYPTQKDETDLQLAYDYVLSQGLSQCIVFGALGGRLDHSVANLQLLSKLKKENCFSLLISEKEACFVLAEGEKVHFSEACEGTFSLFSWNSIGGETKGLKITGALYSTDNDFVLRQDFPMGVSNAFLAHQGQSCQIDVEKGQVLVIYEKQKDLDWPFVVFSKKIDYN